MEGKDSLNGPTPCFCCPRGLSGDSQALESFAAATLTFLCGEGGKAWNMWSEGHPQSCKEGKEVASRIIALLKAQYVPGRKGTEAIPAP